jgi:hypothetical protein
MFEFFLLLNRLHGVITKKKVNEILLSESIPLREQVTINNPPFPVTREPG